MDPFNAYIGLTVLGGLGAGLSLWRARRNLRLRPSISGNWAITERRLLSAGECQVWRWMCKTFPMHQVNLKMPVTRFTRSVDDAQGLGLYQLLDGMYCTFTVCASDGHVVGCADVMGMNGLTRKNWQLKQVLLAKCGIAYCVLKPLSLPTAAFIRHEFLGDKGLLEPVSAPPAPAFSSQPREARYRQMEESLLAEARLKLSTALTRQRRIRDSEFLPLVSVSGGHASAQAHQRSGDGDDADGLSLLPELLPDWQCNSFLAPLGR